MLPEQRDLALSAEVREQANRLVAAILQCLYPVRRQAACPSEALLL